MNDAMAKKKPVRSEHYQLNTRLDPAIGRALEAFIACEEITPSQRAVVEVALRRFLAGKGFDPARPDTWPQRSA